MIKNKKDSLGDRMKGYESISHIYLTKKMPLILRIDGKNFHSFTKGFKRPFDDILMRSMQETAKFLCENIMGCKIAYTQSDEISLLLVDHENNETQPWFDNNLQKLVSISASMATTVFSKSLAKNIYDYSDSNEVTSSILNEKGELKNNEVITYIYLQAYIVQKCLEHPLSELLHLDNEKSTWVGNEVSCGVGMQRMDIVTVQENNDFVMINILELKAEEPYDNVITYQLPWYIDWVKNYWCSLYSGKTVIINPIVIAKMSNENNTERFKNLSKTLVYPTENDVSVSAVEYIAYSIDDDITFEKVFNLGWILNQLRYNQKHKVR